jgi:hypothetical protein
MKKICLRGAIYWIWYYWFRIVNFSDFDLCLSILLFFLITVKILFEKGLKLGIIGHRMYRKINISSIIKVNEILSPPFLA